MTVTELIERLQKFPQDRGVFILSVARTEDREGFETTGSYPIDGIGPMFDHGAVALVAIENENGLPFPAEVKITEDIEAQLNSI